MYIPATLTELIEYSKDLILSHRKFNIGAELYDKSSNTSIQIPFNPIINKYKDYFDKILISVPLTEEEQREYKFAPKKISYELYGTVEYWSMILYINNCHSLLEFEPTILKVLDPDELRELINEILILEGLK